MIFRNKERDERFAVGTTDHATTNTAWPLARRSLGAKFVSLLFRERPSAEHRIVTDQGRLASDQPDGARRAQALPIRGSVPVISRMGHYGHRLLALRSDERDRGRIKFRRVRGPRSLCLGAVPRAMRQQMDAQGAAQLWRYQRPQVAVDVCSSV